jgi:hypothetical protein
MLMSRVLLWIIVNVKTRERGQRLDHCGRGQEDLESSGQRLISHLLIPAAMANNHRWLK